MGDRVVMLRAVILTALAAPGAALMLAGAAPKPTVIARARPIVAVSSLENTWEPEFITTLTDVGITALRLGTCALMVHHGFDKIQNVDGFSANVVAKFFGFLPGPPQFWTLSAAGTQIAGAFLLSLWHLLAPDCARDVGHDDHRRRLPPSQHRPGGVPARHPEGPLVQLRACGHVRVRARLLLGCRRWQVLR